MTYVPPQCGGAVACRSANLQVAEAGDEAEALRRLLRLKARELKTLRRLGQEALLQRSEVEIFLISSLHQVGAMQGRRRLGGWWSPARYVHVRSTCAHKLAAD